MTTRRKFLQYSLSFPALFYLPKKSNAAKLRNYPKLPGDDRFIVVDGWVLLATDVVGNDL